MDLVDTSSGKGGNILQIDQQRLWKTLDQVLARMSSLEDKLTQIALIEERVKSHGETLSRYGRRLEENEEKTHEIELTLARRNPTALRKDIEAVKEGLEDVKKEVKKLKDEKPDDYYHKGMKDARGQMVNSVLKWFSGIIAAIIVFYYTTKK